MSKKLEDLTLEEIKAQMSIYQTLYYKKRKQEDPEFAEKMKQKDREKYLRKRGKANHSRQETKNIIILD